MNSQVQVTPFGSTFPGIESRPRALAERIARFGVWLRQLLCAVNGHDRYLHVDGGRVTLRCVSCQHDSPGWEIGGRAYQRTCAGDPARHRIR